jgi:acyl transferase domain-containing protein
MSDHGLIPSPNGVAIIGMAGRFPGARSLEELWRNLRDGVESISFFTEEELIAAGADPGTVGHPGFVAAKGVIDGVELFDPAFFGFTPREAELMDPQHRILLECAWEALEDAGCDPDRFPGRAAVYVGSGPSSYLISNLLPNAARLEKVGFLQALILNDRDFAATRLSYKLNLRGPSAVVQTACSTSLMAVHMACQSLLAGEADLALAGGVSVNVPVQEGYLYEEGSIASADGHCRSYDAGATGSVAGTGAGLVVLKRLADALADGDMVHAVILGSAANNDGAAKVGFTAPSIEGQADAIAESLLMAGVEPDTIGYVEGHGSATPLGDPIEIAALRKAFETAGHSGQPCALGSVKSNIGHLNTAAGVAGLIKAVLALRHATIPPSLHFERPNPQADFGPFYVPVKALSWPEEMSPRRAGVSSFGLGGTNVHAVLEEAPAPEPSGPSRPWQLLLLSARTPVALEAQAARLAERLQEGLEIADAAFTLHAGRKAFGHRRALVCRDVTDAVTALREGRGSYGSIEGGERPAVFLFPGLGDHSVDMGRDLYETEPAFAAEVDRCAEILEPHLGIDLREVLFSPGPWSPADGERKADLRSLLRRGSESRDEASRRLDRTEHAQPAVFVVEHALAKLLISWGIRPQAMIGYSLGEYVAACLSGALSLEDALALVAKRARLIQELPGGAMLAVPLPEAEVRSFLKENLAVSATNGPHFTVVGGPEEAVADLDRRLAERGVSCIRLTTTHAFHTPRLEPAAAGLTELARGARIEAPKIPYLSNVTGTWITAADLQDPGYWARHMVQPVRFAEGLAELLKDPDRAMLEVGPGGTLSTLVRQHEAGRVAAATGSDLAGLLDAIGRLWVEGVAVDAEGFFAGRKRRRVPLPTYPFERQRCWIDPPSDAGPARPAAIAREADLADWFYVPVWKQTAPVVTAGATDPDPGSWLIFLDRQGFGADLAARLEREGRKVATVAAGTLDRREDYDALVRRLRQDGGLPSRIAHLWGLDETALETGLLSLVYLEQALVASGADGPAIRIAMVGHPLHEVLEGDLVDPARAAVAGACRVVHQESSRLTCFSLDAPPDANLADRVLAELSRETPDPVVAYRGRRRWVRAFDRARISAGAAAPSSPLREGGVYLIAGDGNADGLAEFLTETVKANVVRQAGEERLDGAFFVPGSFAGGLIQLKTREALEAALAPVEKGARALLDALKDDPSAFVVLMSSTLGFTGGLGQVDLAAAGAYLDALAQSLSGDRRVVAAHWDPYQWNAWLAAGLGALAQNTQGGQQQDLAAAAVPVAASGEALKRLLASGLPRVVVSARDLETVITETDALTAESFFARMAPARHGEKAQRPGISTPYAPPRNEREEKLAALWEELFGIAPVGVHDNFLELGGHSLLAIQVVTQIRAQFEADLPVTALFEAPTVAELAKLIARAKGEESPEDLEALLALVEGLSPEEAAERLAELGV